MSIFLIVLDLVLIGVAGYYLYWQRQITVASRYATSQLVWTVILGFWFLTTRINDLTYIVFISIFLVLSLMAGTGGLTPKRLVANGILARVIPYARLSSITLTPLNLPNGDQWVVAMFTSSQRRMIRLTFNTKLSGLISELRQVIPSEVPITVQQVQ